MYSIGLITRIGPVTDGPKPQMGPEHTIPLFVEVQTSGGPGSLELSQGAALELVEALSQRLKARGCL
jgi:hypothetical protein